MNKEVCFQKDELLRKSAFSADDFAAVGLPGLPGTARAWRDLLKTTDWPSRAVRSRGRGGLKHEYEPPAELLEVMRRHLRGEEVTKDEVAAARAVSSPSPRAQQQAAVDEHGWHPAEIAAYYPDTEKVPPAFQSLVGNLGIDSAAWSVIKHVTGAGKTPSGRVLSLPAGAGKTMSMTRLTAEALSAGFARAIWLVDAGQAELLMLGNRTIARLEEESARRQLQLDAFVGDPEILDAALRLEWLLMQREPQASPADQP